ncbi:MAG: DUF1491 family protein [Rhodospirillales bacterium]|nr:DUF1491 family protein [Rhodospirillales bacterium]
MSEPRLKSELWIKAQLRLCDLNCMPAVIARRGDVDAGQILIKVMKSRISCDLLARRFDAQGRRAWMILVQGAESDCDAYVAREADIDPDLWVLEIEDPRGLYKPDGEEPAKFL